jgi:hypothetical protein
MNRNNTGQATRGEVSGKANRIRRQATSSIRTKHSFCATAATNWNAQSCRSALCRTQDTGKPTTAAHTQQLTSTEFTVNLRSALGSFLIKRIKQLQRTLLTDSKTEAIEPEESAELNFATTSLLPDLNFLPYDVLR